MSASVATHPHRSAKPSQRANFDLIARSYRWMEYCSFGPLLERCRFAQLDHLAGARHALVLGDGDGRFVARMLAQYPELTAHVVEASPEMVRLARRRVDRIRRQNDDPDRVEFFTQDVRRFTPSVKDRYDLVVAHFFLDCLTEAEIAEVLHRLSPSVCDGATWVISEFAIPEPLPLRAFARILIASLYFAFRMLTRLRVRRLPDYAAIFRMSGLARKGTTLFLGGILRSELWRSDS